MIELNRNLSKQRHSLTNLQLELSNMEGVAVVFSLERIKDGGVRANYIKQAQRISADLLSKVRSGQLQAEAAAEEAVNLRNRIMEYARADTSKVGSLIAQDIKPSGYTLESRQILYSKRIFNRLYQDLDGVSKTIVNKEVIRAAGRTDVVVNRNVKWASRFSKGLIGVTALLAVDEIANAENKVQKTATVVGGLGLQGLAATGATTGVLAVCTLTAPVCATAALLASFVAAAGVGLGWEWFTEKVSN